MKAVTNSLLATQVRTPTVNISLCTKPKEYWGIPYALRCCAVRIKKIFWDALYYLFTTTSEEKRFLCAIKKACKNLGRDTTSNISKTISTKKPLFFEHLLQRIDAIRWKLGTYNATIFLLELMKKQKACTQSCLVDITYLLESYYCITPTKPFDPIEKYEEDSKKKKTKKSSQVKSDEQLFQEYISAYSLELLQYGFSWDKKLLLTNFKAIESSLIEKLRLESPVTSYMFGLPPGAVPRILSSIYNQKAARTLYGSQISKAAVKLIEQEAASDMRKFPKGATDFWLPFIIQISKTQQMLEHCAGAIIYDIERNTDPEKIYTTRILERAKEKLNFIKPESLFTTLMRACGSAQIDMQQLKYTTNTKKEKEEYFFEICISAFIKDALKELTKYVKEHKFLTSDVEQQRLKTFVKFCKEKIKENEQTIPHWVKLKPLKIPELTEQ